MRLLSLTAYRYRSLMEQTIELRDLNVFIGVNASGKSTILDGLRFLHEAVVRRDFRGPVFSRGGVLHLAWKGAEAQRIGLTVRVQDGGEDYEWSAQLTPGAYEFRVDEQVTRVTAGSPRVTLLESSAGEGWWWSDNERKEVKLKQDPTACALAAAAADASFPAREVAEYVGHWGFFDPNPFLLRRDWPGLDLDGLDHYGRNLGETLYAIQKSRPEVLKQIVEATRSFLGLPVGIEPREAEDRFYFMQDEGLRFRVHQMGVSSGTLRVLALMTALHGEPGANLIGVEEPENYVHPSALLALVECMKDMRARVQFLVTTHSPLVLNYLNEPEAVSVVSRSNQSGTAVTHEQSPEGVRKALVESGFGLGELYQTTGFGS
jgi:predicted ATPase